MRLATALPDVANEKVCIKYNKTAAPVNYFFWETAICNTYMPCNHGTICSFFVIVPWRELWNDKNMHLLATHQNNVRTIALLGFSGAAALDITGPYEVFAAASQLRKDRKSPLSRLVLPADHAGHFLTMSGLGMVADASWRYYTENPDTLLIASGQDVTPLVDNAELLESTGTPLAAATRESGCNGSEQLRRAFQLHRGITPQEYRQRFSSADDND